MMVRSMVMLIIRWNHFKLKEKVPFIDDWLSSNNLGKKTLQNNVKKIKICSLFFHTLDKKIPLDSSFY